MCKNLGVDRSTVSRTVSLFQSTGGVNKNKVILKKKIGASAHILHYFEIDLYLKSVLYLETFCREPSLADQPLTQGLLY